MSGLLQTADLSTPTTPSSPTGVHVGSIGLRNGNPTESDPWQWRCGFNPGLRPGECTSGTAETFESARIEGVTERSRWRGWPLEGQHAAYSRLRRQAGQLPRTYPQRIDNLRIGRRPASYAHGQQVTRDDLRRLKVRASAEQAADARKVAADDGG